MTSEDFKVALKLHVGFEALSVNETPKQLRLLGRVPQNRVAAWLELMTDLLKRAEPKIWTLDVSKQYFLRGSKLIYGWRIILQSETLKAQVALLTPLIKELRSKPVEFSDEQEIPLHASQFRHAGGPGRGSARTIGEFESGPRRS